MIAIGLFGIMVFETLRTYVFDHTASRIELLPGMVVRAEAVAGKRKKIAS